MLWSFRQNSFIPHGRLEDLDGPLLEAAVIVTEDPAGLPAELYDVLIVVTEDGMPESFERFRRVQDFAPTYDPQAQKAARERYAACQSAGYKMRFVPLKKDG
jgi:DNA polymerase IIIc chi subunit